MIAFRREALEPRDQFPRPILIVIPQLITRQKNGNRGTSEARTKFSKLIDNKVARQQQELAMLQRALGRCGLIGIKHNNEE